MSTGTTFSAAGDIQGEERSALIDLLYRLGDDDLMIGHRNSEWTGLAPILEADIAFSSMAQDEIGRALSYYRMLHALGEPDPDTIAFTRAAAAYRCASLASLDRSDWAFSTVRQYFYDVATTRRLALMADSSYTPLSQFVRKVGGEQKYHMMHSRMWVVRLGKGTDESRLLMQQAVEKAYPHALGMFEATEWDAVIAGSGIGPCEADVEASWVEEVAEHLSASGLAVPTNVEPTYGGRCGRHPEELGCLLEEMQKVYKLEPSAPW